MSKYNGWTNYATWRVNLEVFDGWQTECAVDADMCREMVEEIIYSTTPEGLARDYALTFIHDVDWHSIAEHVNEANALTADAD